MTAVHQFVPTFEPGAVGSHMLAARAVLRAAGWESEVFAEHIHPAFAPHGAHSYRDYGRRLRARADDRLLYHVAIGSVVGEFVRERRELLVVDYHNLTPLHLLNGWEPAAAHGVAWGRAQLVALASRTALGIADSAYNELDLRAAGYRPTSVVPILVPPDALAVEPDPSVLEHLRATRRAGGADWIFVGRLAANKAQHDIVKAFCAYRRFHDPSARLFLVGGGADDTYGTTLRHFADKLGLADAVTVTGSVSPAALAAYWANADIFVVCSEHEGFCVPLLEAMHHDVPIVAYAKAAVPETLGDAGVLLTDKDPCTVAAAVDRVIHDAPLRAQLIAAGRERLADFALTRTGPALVSALEGIGSP